MSTKPEDPESKSRGLFSSLATLVSPLILLVLLFIATLIGGLGVVLVGWIVSQVFSLSLFEASLIALGTALGVAYLFAQILRPQPKFPWLNSDWLDEDDDAEDEEDFEDDEEFDDFPPSKSSASAQLPRAEPMPGRNDPCWCGSGRKYKNCHGR